jgi:hypothetical protein
LEAEPEEEPMMTSKKRADQKAAKRKQWKDRQSRKKWKEMPPQARVGAVVVGAIQLSLLLAAQRDISRRPAEQIRGSKIMWRLVSFVNFIGPGSYFAFGRKKLPVTT